MLHNMEISLSDAIVLFHCAVHYPGAAGKERAMDNLHTFIKASVNKAAYDDIMNMAIQEGFESVNKYEMQESLSRYGYIFDEKPDGLRLVKE